MRVEQALAAATAAGRLRRARIARVGRPIDGYDCVDVDADALRAATGLELVPVEPAAFRDAYLRADPARVAELDAEARATFDLAADVEEGETLLRSLRCAAALEALDAELGVQGGIMNCHVPEIRRGEEPGITPCYALGRETSRGIPWTCSGDAVTAVAMLTTTLLGGAAVYHELESLDYSTDEALIANSGEHDLRWCDPAERPALVRNHWFASDPRCGACACFGPPAGPGTLVAFTPHADEPSGFRYVVAEGELTPRRFPVDGHGPRRLPLRRRAGRCRLGALGRRGCEPPLVGDAGASRRRRRRGRAAPGYWLCAGLISTNELRARAVAPRRVLPRVRGGDDEGVRRPPARAAAHRAAVPLQRGHRLAVRAVRGLAVVDPHRAAAPGLDRRAAGRVVGDVLAVRARHGLGDDDGAGPEPHPRRAAGGVFLSIPLEPVQAVAAAVVVAAVLIALPGAFATLERRGATLRICIAACGFASITVLSRLLADQGASTIEIYVVRTTAAGLIYTIAIPPRNVPLSVAPKLFLRASFITAHFLLVIEAVRRGSPTVVQTALATTPLIAMGVEAVRHGRRPSLRVALCALAVLAAVALLALE